VNLLIDTPVFLWILSGDRRLKAKSRDVIRNADRGFVSLVSAWEVAIKAGLGKLVFPIQFEPAITESGLTPLAISFAHVAAIQHLPNHHRDPFDRLLVAQAVMEGLTLISADHRLAKYGIPFVAV
jgi:PIN domain nuclease of toxin-antitoxin system